MKSYYINEKCIGCTLCAKICLVGAISGELKQRHKVDTDLCIRCGACGKVCAKEAVEDENGNIAARLPKRSEWPKPYIDSDKCAGCSVCVELCPNDCLKITAPAFHGDIRTVAALNEEHDCIACGRCAANCPIDAITMLAPGQKVEDVRGKEKRKGNTMSKIWCRTFQAVMKFEIGRAHV